MSCFDCNDTGIRPCENCEFDEDLEHECHVDGNVYGTVLCDCGAGKLLLEEARTASQPEPSSPEKFTVTVLKHDDDHVFENIVAFEIKDDCYCMIDDTQRRFVVPMSTDIMWIETVKQ